MSNREISIARLNAKIYTQRTALINYQDLLQEKKSELAKLKKQLDVKEAMIKNYTAEIETQRQQLAIDKKYLSLIKRNVSVGSLAYTYVANAQTEIKELNK